MQEFSAARMQGIFAPRNQEISATGMQGLSAVVMQEISASIDKYHSV